MTHTPDHSDLVPAATVATEFEAQTKAVVLRDAGIDSFVFADGRSWLGGANVQFLGGGGVQVMVRSTDLERATQVLESQIADSVDLDWNEVDVGEPDEREVEDSRRGRSALRFVIAAVAVIIVLYGLRMLALSMFNV